MPHAHAHAAGPRRDALPLQPHRAAGTGAHRQRYRFVFFALMLTLVANPLLAALDLDRTWLTAFVGVSVLAAVFGVVPGRARRVAILGLTAVAVVVSNLPDTVAANWVTTAAMLSWMLVMAFAIGVSVRYALGQPSVGTDQVYAALSGYLLAGMLFAMIYIAVERAYPGSIGPAGATVPAQLGPGAAFYFSFVTLATLGYGDIVPLSGVLRGIAVLEAVAGQLYLAVMVAILVSGYSQLRGARK